MQPYKVFNIILAILLLILSVFVAYGYISIWWLLPPLILHLSIFFLGAVNIRWNFYLNSFYKAKNKKLLALTFDDGPSAYTVQILDILKEQNIKASFFTIGERAAQNTALVKRWHDEGHIIGNHSYQHGFNFDWQSSKKMANEILQTNHVIERITGLKPKLFRPPYGITNPNLARAVRKTNMHSIGWTLRSFDTKTTNADYLFKNIFNKLKGGDIILLHDSMEVTAKILTPLIQQAKQMGYTFVPVNEILEIEPYKKS